LKSRACAMWPPSRCIVGPHWLDGLGGPKIDRWASRTFELGLRNQRRLVKSGAQPPGRLEGVVIGPTLHDRAALVRHVDGAIERGAVPRQQANDGPSLSNTGINPMPAARLPCTARKRSRPGGVSSRPLPLMSSSASWRWPGAKRNRSQEHQVCHSSSSTPSEPRHGRWLQFRRGMFVSPPDSAQTAAAGALLVKSFCSFSHCALHTFDKLTRQNKQRLIVD
jgi:hypothetical protein